MSEVCYDWLKWVEVDIFLLKWVEVG